MQIPVTLFMFSRMFSPSGCTVCRCTSISTGVNTYPVLMFPPNLKGRDCSVYPTHGRPQQSTTDNDGSDENNWVCLLSDTEKGRKIDKGLLSSYYESGSRFTLKIYHQPWLFPQTWLLYPFQHWTLRLRKAESCTHVAEMAYGNLALCYGSPTSHP